MQILKSIKALVAKVGISDRNFQKFGLFFPVSVQATLFACVIRKIVRQTFFCRHIGWASILLWCFFFSFSISLLSFPLNSFTFHARTFTSSDRFLGSVFFSHSLPRDGQKVYKKKLGLTSSLVDLAGFFLYVFRSTVSWEFLAGFFKYVLDQPYIKKNFAQCAANGYKKNLLLDPLPFKSQLKKLARLSKKLALARPPEAY